MEYNLQCMYGNMYGQYKFMNPRSIGNFYGFHKVSPIIYLHRGTMIPPHMVKSTGEKKVDKYVYFKRDFDKKELIYVKHKKKVDELTHYITFKFRLVCNNISINDSNRALHITINKVDKLNKVNERIIKLTNLISFVRSETFIAERNDKLVAKHFFPTLFDAHRKLKGVRKNDSSFISVSDEEIDKILRDQKIELRKFVGRDGKNDRDAEYAWKAFMYITCMIIFELSNQIKCLRNVISNIEKLSDDQPIIKGTYGEDFYENAYYEYDEVSKQQLDNKLGQHYDHDYIILSNIAIPIYFRNELTDLFFQFDDRKKIFFSSINCSFSEKSTVN